MRTGVFLAHVMRVVRGNEGNACFLGKPGELWNQNLVLIQPVILNLQEKIVLAEKIHVAVGQTLGFFVAVRHQRLVDVAPEARRHGDQALGMLRQQIFIDARLVIKTFEETGGDQPQQVAITLLVLAEQHQVVIAVRIAARGVPLLRDVDFASDHRMHALFLGLVVELDGAKKIAVVGHGHGGHFLMDHQVHQLSNFTGSIQQRIIGMAMQVYE